MEGKEQTSAASPASPSASTLRWAILRRAFLSRSSPPSDPPDHASQMGIKNISRKTASHFNLIPFHLLTGSSAEDLSTFWKNKLLGSQRDIYVCYKLPVATSPRLIMIQRIENYVALKDFEISNKYDVDNTGLICCWPSEDVLAHFCLNHPDMFSCKRILELGSGYGLAGLAIAAGTNACEVVISDGNPQVVDYIQCNINANASLFGDTKVKSMMLHWNHVPDSNIMNTFDIIVASDCTFFREFHESLALTVKIMLIHSKTSQALFLSPKRGDSLDRFLDKVKKIGLQFEVVENYDIQVWERHLNFLNSNDTSWPNYDKDHCYPLLIRITF